MTRVPLRHCPSVCTYRRGLFLTNGNRVPRPRVQRFAGGVPSEERSAIATKLTRSTSAEKLRNDLSVSDAKERKFSYAHYIDRRPDNVINRLGDKGALRLSDFKVCFGGLHEAQRAFFIGGGERITRPLPSGPNLFVEQFMFSRVEWFKKRVESSDRADGRTHPLSIEEVSLSHFSLLFSPPLYRISPTQRQSEAQIYYNYETVY